MELERQVLDYQLDQKVDARPDSVGRLSLNKPSELRDIPARPESTQDVGIGGIGGVNGSDCDDRLVKRPLLGRNPGDPSDSLG